MKIKFKIEPGDASYRRKAIDKRDGHLTPALHDASCPNNCTKPTVITIYPKQPSYSGGATYAAYVIDACCTEFEKLINLKLE